MPEHGYRLDLWRKALSLFYERRHPAWVGPFKQAGYAGLGARGLKIGPKLLDADGNEGTPDIVSASDNHWVAIELTADEHKPKKLQLDKYAALDGSYLTSHGLPFIPGSPTVIIGRPKLPQSYADDGGHPRMLLGDMFTIEHADKVADAALQAALIAFEGQSLGQTPELRFALLPEQKPVEIRRAIVASVLGIFHPGSEGISIKGMVDDGLDTLVHAIGIEARHRLEKDVEQQMSILLETHKLNEYVLKDGKTYKSKIPDKLPHSKTLKKAHGIIEAWVKGAGFSAPLSRFDTPPAPAATE